MRSWRQLLLPEAADHLKLPLDRPRDVAQASGDLLNAIAFQPSLRHQAQFVVGEHLTDACENITNSMMFLATLIHDTKTIKLATGTTNLAQMHPVVIAVNTAMFDHLSQGRFVMGVSPGALTSDSEAIGILDEDRNKIFPDRASAQDEQEPQPDANSASPVVLGLDVQELTPDRARRLNLGSNHGVLVSDVAPVSFGEDVGFRPATLYRMARSKAPTSR